MDIIDDKPVAGEKGAYDFEAQIIQAELEMQKKLEEEKKEFNLPLDKKIISKNWKCRKSAIDEIYKQITTSNYTSDLLKLLPLLLQDQHQSNLEQGLDCLNLYYQKEIENSKEGETNSILLDIAKSLIEKCYTSSKNSLKEKAKIALLKTVEKLPTTEGICEIMIHIVETKNQKLIQGVVEISKLLLIEFGANAFAYKIIFPQMIKIVDGCMPLIKNEIIGFGKELYCWVRNNIKHFIENKVKETIQQDFAKAFEEIDNSDCIELIPRRFLKGQTIDTIPQMTFHKEEKNQAMEIDEPTKEIDLFGGNTIFTEKWCEDIIAPERKWKEKKEMLDVFIETSQNAIIKDTQRDYFIETIKQLLKDSNINVVHASIVSLGILAKGFKSKFHEGKDLFLILLDFFKEKKEKFTADLFSTLTYIYMYNEDNTIAEIILQFSLQVLPTQSKEKVSQLIAKLSKEKLSSPNKNYLEILIKYSDDPSLEVRTAGLKALAVMKEKYGVVNEINELSEIKIKKIDEYVYLQSIMEGGNELPIPQHMQSSMKVNNSNSNQNNKQTNKNNNKTKKQIECNTTTSNVIEDNNNDPALDDEIDSYIKEKIGNELFAMFNEEKWAIRKDAFVSLSSFILENKEEVNNHLDYYLKFIFLRTKKYKESNVVIIKESITALQIICENCQSFSKKQSQVLINRLIEKISDNKLKIQLQTLFIKFIEYHGPKFIINNLIKNTEGKSIVILKEIALIISKSIEEFDINSFPVKEIVDYCKSLAANTNPQTRNAAISLLSTLYKYLGEPIKAFLNDIKEATKKIIDEEFSKITVIVSTTDANKRTLKGEAAKEAKPKGNVMDSAFPRVDISKKITPKMIKDLLEGQWKVKKEVIDAVDAIIIESNKRILPSGLFDFLTALKQKLKDGNKNLIRIMVQFITRLVEALGNGIKTYLRLIIEPVLNNLSDKMNLLREDIVKFLDKLIEILGFEAVACNLPPFLKEENFELRTELLKLLLKHKDSIAKFEGIKEFIPAVISCLLDKGPSIRAMGEEYAMEILRYVNINNFYPHLKVYKPAIANSIKLIIDKYASLICVDMKDNINLNDMNVEMKDCSNIINPIQQQNPSEKNNRQKQNNTKGKQNNALERKVESKSIDSNQQKITLNNQIPLNIVPINPSDIMLLKRKPSFEIITQEISVQMNPITQKKSNSFEAIPEMKRIELSKSPLLPMYYSRISKDESGIKKQNLLFNINEIDQEQLSILISILYTGDTSDKNNALIEIGNLFTAPSSSVLLLIEKNIRDILIAMNSLLSSSFELFNNQNVMNNSINQSLTSLRFLVSAYYKISLCKSGIEKVKVDTIYCSYERLLISILTDNIENIPNGKMIIKSLNSLMLKLIENFPHTSSFIALIRLIFNYRLNTNSRVCILSIKCILKLSNIMKEIYHLLDVEKILISIYEFLFELEKANGDIEARNENEEMCLKILKNVLNELLKNGGHDSIWKLYKSSIENNNLPDKHLKKWIQLIRRSNNGNSLPLPSNIIFNQSKNKFESKASYPNDNPKMQISPEKSTPTLMTNLLGSFNKEETIKMTIMNEMRQYVDRIGFAKDQKEIETSMYEIVYALKRNRLNVEYMADKMNENDYISLLKIFRSLDDNSSYNDISKSKSIKSQGESKLKPFTNNEKENNDGNQSIPSGLRTLQDYRQKLYKINEKEAINSQQKLLGNIEGHINTISERDIEFEELKQKREKLDESAKIMMNSTHKNNNNIQSNALHKNNNQSQLQNNQDTNYGNNIAAQQIERINEMRRKLESLRGYKSESLK